jgi:hypothetical protein
MTRSILKSWCLAAAVFAVPARALAIWPPSTSFVVESEVAPVSAEAEKLPATLPHPVRAVTSKLEQDERRLQKVLQDLKDDEAALQQVIRTAEFHS